MEIDDTVRVAKKCPFAELPAYIEGLKIEATVV